MIACKDATLLLDEPLNVKINFNEALLEKIFNEEYKKLCSYFEYKFKFTHDEAKDAVHIGFVKLWENREMLSSYASIKGYLFKIIINICLDIVKHRNVREKHEKNLVDFISATTFSNALENLDAKQLVKDIEISLAKMPPQMRTVFQLSRFDGLKYAEIAAKLNISIKTVETQMSRALERLRKNLSSYIKFSIFILLSLLN